MQNFACIHVCVYMNTFILETHYEMLSKSITVKSHYSTVFSFNPEFLSFVARLTPPKSDISAVHLGTSS